MSNYINSMKWRGDWVDGIYIPYDVIIDNGWTMIANKKTTDRPSPQPIGPDEDSIDKNYAFIEESDISIIKMIHKFTASKSGWLKSLSVRVPFWDLDSVSRVIFYDKTRGVSKVVDNPILSSDNWVTLSISSILIVTGNEFEVWFEFYNSAAANNIAGGWNSLLGTGIPTSQQFTIDNLTTPTVIEVSHTDLDSTDRSTELDGVTVDSIISIIETADAERNVEAKVLTIDTVSATSTKYTVSLLNNGVKAIRSGVTCTLNINVPITQPSRYTTAPAYYPTNNPSWASITTELYYDGVQQANTTDAYGINVNFQEATISDDWDLVAASDTASSSGSLINQISSVAVFEESTSLSIIDSGQSFPTDSSGTLFSNDATTIVDSTKGGVKAGHGNYDVAGSFFDVSLIDKPCQIFFKCVVTPNNNANFGIEYRSYTDKTNIPGSLLDSQSSAYKISRSGMSNEVTTSFLYNPEAGKIEALQIFGVSQNNESVILGFFNFILNKLYN